MGSYFYACHMGLKGWSREGPKLIRVLRDPKGIAPRNAGCCLSGESPLGTSTTRQPWPISRPSHYKTHGSHPPGKESRMGTYAPEDVE